MENRITTSGVFGVSLGCLLYFILIDLIKQKKLIHADIVV